VASSRLGTDGSAPTTSTIFLWLDASPIIGFSAAFGGGGTVLDIARQAI
jgi:hypothetical protein